MQERYRQPARDVDLAAPGDPHRKVAFLVSEDWWFRLHWANMAARIRDAGYSITVICHVGRDRALIEAAGFNVLPLQLNRSSLNIFRDLANIWKVARWLRLERPALIHCVGIKPILIGTLSGLLVGGVATLNHFAGLGYLFSSRHLKARLLRPLILLTMRLAFRRRQIRVVTMNTEDCELLVGRKVVTRERVQVVPGTGLDVTEFPFMPAPIESRPLTVAVVARMLEDKGIPTLVEAFRLLRGRIRDARLILVGTPDKLNPTALSADQLRAWAREPGITWLARVEHVRDVWKHSHIAVLPSRREGLPVSLLEAAACGRPLIATDVPGCRDVVIPGETGLLVPPDNPYALADALERLANSASLRARLGHSARKMIEMQYTVDTISAQIAALYDSMVLGSAIRDVRDMTKPEL